jgi:hypothetical protein
LRNTTRKRRDFGDVNAVFVLFDSGFEAGSQPLRTGKQKLCPT